MNPLDWTVGRWARVSAGVALLLYLPSLLNGFVYDDVPIILQNPSVQGLSNIGEILTSPYWPGERGPEMGLWRPVTSLAFALLWTIANGAAWVFHLANVLLHAAVVALVVRVLDRLMPTPPAGLAGLVFAVHPVHVEAVANGVGLAELLAALLLLLALHLVLRHDADRDPLERRPLPLPATLSVLGLYALAFGAKEAAVVLPGLVVLVDAYRGRLEPRDLPGWLRLRGGLLAGMTAVAVAILLLRARVLGSIASALPPLGAELLPEIPRIWTLGEIWAQTLRLVAIPTWLSPDYSPDVVPVLTVWTPRAILGVAGVLAVLVATWAAARVWARSGDVAAGGIAFGVGWFVIAVSPVSNFFFVAGVLVAERTLYLPSVGIAALVGAVVSAGVVRIPARAVPVVGVAFLALLTLWGVRSATYLPVWRTQDSVFGYMAERVPESYRSRWMRADLTFQQGDVESAVRQYRALVAGLGAAPVYLTRTARTLIGGGRAELARPFLERAWEEEPDRAQTAELLAVTAAQREEWPAVESWTLRALELDEGRETSWHLLSVSHAARGEWLPARRAREALLERGSRDAWQQWYWLTELRARSGDAPGARAAADSARARAPGPAATNQIDSLLVALGISGADPR